MDGQKCMEMCAHTHTHTVPLNSWECLQCERVLGSPLGPTQWPVHCLCLHCTKLKHRSFPSLPPFQRAATLAFVKAWPQVALGKHGAKFIEKSTRISGVHLIHFTLCFLPRQLIVFLHSSRGHGDISRALFHFLNNGSHKDKAAVGKKLVHQVQEARLLSSLSLLS